MSAIPFDAFAFTHSLVDAGVPDKQADSIAQAFNKAIQESNAAIIEQVRRDYRLDDITTNKDLDARIKETELRIELVRADLKRDISDAKAELSRTMLTVGVGVGLVQLVSIFLLFMQMTGKV
ncbi:MAG: DUF1640 domain-containing protein [Methylococcaceae bacterium]